MIGVRAVTEAVYGSSDKGLGGIAREAIRRIRSEAVRIQAESGAKGAKNVQKAAGMRNSGRGARRKGSEESISRFEEEVKQLTK